MRELILIISCLFLVGTSLAAEEQYKAKDVIPICSLYHFKSVKKKLLPVSNDKYMHCAVSCMLTKRCGALDTYGIGVLKEVWDLFTPGDADWKDIEADLIGINFYLNKTAINDKECNIECKNYDWSQLEDL